MACFRISISLLSSALFSLLVCSGNPQELESPWISLNNGRLMPLIGFGTHFRSPVNEKEIILDALRIGYRLFDTAWAYKNEKNLGSALEEWFQEGGNRDEIFITTKLPVSGLRATDVEIYLNDSLNNLGLDYIDMYLIHAPFGFNRLESLDTHFFKNGTVDLDPTTDHLSIWKAMEAQVRAGRVRSIGLSSFNASQINNIWNHAEIKPSNLQVEGNLYIQQRELRTLCNELGIAITAFSPIGSNDSHLPAPMKNPVVLRIAEKHNKTPTQILLRYDIHLGFTVIPNTKNSNRMRENLSSLDFELNDDDLEELEALDQHGRYRKYDFEAIVKGSSKHSQYPFADRALMYT